MYACSSLFVNVARRSGKLFVNSKVEDLPVADVSLFPVTCISAVSWPKHDGERERESGELPLGWTAQTGALPLSYTRVLFSEGATPVC